MSAKEAIDMAGSRRKGSGPKAGSVWESRMKIDQVKGGIKVFNGTHENHSQEHTQNTNNNSTALNNSPEAQMDKKVSPKQSPKQSPVGVSSGKRKTWKSESSEGSPIHIARLRSDLSKSLDESSGVSDGIQRSPVQIKKTRNLDKNRKVKSEVKNESKIEDFKVKSEPCNGNLDSSSKSVLEDKNVLDEKSIKNSGGDGDEKVVDETNKALEGSTGSIDKSPDGSDIQDCKEFGVCEEKNAITSNVEQIKSKDDDDFVDVEEDYKEIGVEKKSVDVKEISVLKEQKPNKIVIQNNQRSVPVSTIVKKLQPPPSVNHARFNPPPPTKTKPSSDHFRPRTNSKLQSFVDLVMWRDVSKSAFVFGIGTFAIISSSYTKDLNISFISVVSYLGLVYLAANFLFRSLINRGSVDMDEGNEEYVVGEEEAIWVIKLVLPYINEFLLKLRALFSGDPSTTMKLAVLLFILARCGSSITIWKMAKLGFIGVFTVPKVCSMYSSQLTAYGTFWIRRFRDAWESCSHKKAVGFAIFTLVWNLSSVVARIWAVFMLFVALKYYHHKSLMKEGWANDHEEATTSTQNNSSSPSSSSSWQGQRRSTLTEMTKQKKVC